MVMAVPLFFFMSGYLYFISIGNDNFSFATWKKKTHNRIKSLVIPYLVWNLLIMLLFGVVQAITGNSETMQRDGYKLIADYQFIDYLKAVWAIDSTGLPMDGPLWFVRDLMVTAIVFSYPIWLLMKKTGVWGLMLIWIAWQFVGVHLPGFSMACIFYFSWGALCAINNFDLFTNVSKKRSWQFGACIITCLAVYSVLSSIDSRLAGTFRQLYIYITILLVFGWLAPYIKEEKIKPVAMLGNASFFIYAMHKPVQVIFRRYSFAIFNPTSELELSLLAIFIPMIVIGICLFAFYVVKNYMPCLKFLNGFRL